MNGMMNILEALERYLRREEIIWMLIIEKLGEYDLFNK